MKELQTELIDAVIEAAKVVSSTMGPNGHNVALLKNGFPITVRDGVFIARELQYEDPIKQMGAKLLADAANTTVAEAGDGTTTTCAMVWGMLEEFKKLTDVNLPEFISDLKNEVNDAIEYLEVISKPCKDISILENVATVSANNDSELGKKVAEMVFKIGSQGAVFIEESISNETTIKVENGYSFDGKPIAQIEKTITLDSPYILLAEEKIVDQHTLVPIYEEFKKLAFDNGRWSRSLICIVSDIQDSALRAAMLNYQQNRVPVFFVKAPELGERRLSAMRDLQAITGSHLFSEYLGFRLRGVKNKKPSDMFGMVDQARIDRHKTTLFFSGRQDDIKDRVSILSDEMQKHESGSDYYKFLESSISKLTGGVGFINVGGHTDAERAYTGMLLDDSVMACKSALKRGVIDGLARNLYLVAAKNKVMVAGLSKPLQVLAENNYMDVDDLYKKNNILNGNVIYDPLQVAISVIKNSVSLVEQIIRTKYVKA